MLVDTYTFKTPATRTAERDSSVDMIVLHSTETDSLKETINYLTLDKNRIVSAHYVIDQDGMVYHLTPTNLKTFHAGVSSWTLHTGETVSNINDRSIGIEFQRGGTQNYTPAQIRAGLELTKSLMEHYNIHPHNIVAHADIAPKRKSDPCKDFPWEIFVQNEIAENLHGRKQHGSNDYYDKEMLQAKNDGVFDLKNETTIYAKAKINKINEQLLQTKGLSYHYNIDNLSLYQLLSLMFFMKTILHCDDEDTVKSADKNIQQIIAGTK